MTSDEITKFITENTTCIKHLTTLLNDHLHEHTRLRFWLFTFLITTNLTSLGTILTLLIKM